MSDTNAALGKRVALLARPGAARERLRGALTEAGGVVVLEADPLTLAPAELDAARAQVVMVALDPQTEDALDRFEAALQDPGIDVIFEEAEIAAAREGWEAARWVRHLSAKLHRHRDVLPPGAEPSGTGGQHVPLPAMERVTAAGPVSVATPSDDPTPVAGALALGSVDAELPWGDGTHALADAAAGQASDQTASGPAFDFDLDFSYDGSLDAVALEPAADAADASAHDAGESGPAAARFGSAALHELSCGIDPTELAPDFVVHGGDQPGVDPPGFDQPGFDVPDFDAPGFDMLFDDPGSTAASDAGAAVSGSFAGTATARVLELVGADDSPRAASADAVDSRFKHDLASLESRIAGMELVDDRIVKGPAQASGAVLVLAGIGGPDAVRQLLGALPVDFPRPVLVQQRLDGGRYDKLVAQMQRATALQVALAAPGLPAVAGTVYILPAKMAIKVSDSGIEFVASDAQVLTLMPSADSAVLLLSGSDPDQVDAAMNQSWAGALVIGQSPDGCYDATAPSALIARGGNCGQPAELARRLVERWPH